MRRYRSPNDTADYKLIEDFDPTLVHKVARLYLPILERYHRAEFLGMENIPDGPFLGVGNHTGIHFMPESFLWLCKYHADAGHRPMYTLVHDFVYRMADKLGLPLHALGILDAEKGSAYEALQEGCAVTVYPAGDRDNAKPFWERNEIDFFGHTGYVTLALNAGVPIVPVVGVGGGESVFTLASGSRIAEWTGLKKVSEDPYVADILVFSFRVACGPFSCAWTAAAHAGDGERARTNSHIGLWGGCGQRPEDRCGTERQSVAGDAGGGGPIGEGPDTCDRADREEVGQKNVLDHGGPRASVGAMGWAIPRL